MEKFKEASVVGNIVRRLPNGMVEVNYDGTMVVLPQNTNEIKFEKGGKSSTLNFSNFFYSPLEKVIAESKFAKLPAKQWAEKFGRTEEAKWTGLADWLAQQGGSVSKADIQQFLADNRIRIEEIVKGSRSYTMEDVAEYLFGKSYSKLNEEEKENVQIEYDARALGDTSGEDGDDTKFSKYQLEGEKENYKEILVTLPIKMPTYNPITELPSGYDITFDILKNTYAVIEENQSSGRSITGRYHSTKEDAVKNAIEVINSQRKNVITSNLFDSQFKSSHFYEPNILVHLRMNTRTDAAGNKVLFLEEIQSDWGQKGKREGFGNRSAVIKELPNGTFSVQSLSDGTNVNTRQEAERVAEKYKIKGIAPAPFVTDTSTWVKLALKVALKEAIAQGAAKIAWTTGEQQNDRYDLSKSVDEIIIVKQPDGTYIVAGIKDGRNVINENSVAENRVELFVGKHIANKAINEGQTTFSGSDLKVGGKGMTGFYGSPKEGVLGIVGNVAKSLFKQQPKTVEIEVGKKYSGYIEVLDMEGNVVNTYGGAASTTHNAEIEAENIGGTIRRVAPKVLSTQYSIDITPELRTEATQVGFPLFSEGGELSRGSVAIINRNSNFGTLDGVITKNTEINKLIIQHLKAGTAKKMIDTEDTLMYELKSSTVNFLAPNGQPSNLTPEQYKLVRTPAFKAFFGDWENSPETASKVVDENGEPLVVYHGTPNSFELFKITDRIVSGYGIREYGIYFTNSILTAKEYSLPPKESKEHLEWNDALDKLKTEQDFAAWMELYNSGKDKYKKEQRPATATNGRILECFLNIRNPVIKDAGGKHWFTAFKNISFSGDGVICTNVIEVFEDIQNTYIVYSPNQIKLANDKPDMLAKGGKSSTNFPKEINAALEAVQRANSVKFWLEPEFNAETYYALKKHQPNSFLVTDTVKPEYTSKNVFAYDEKGDLVGMVSILTNSTKKAEIGAFKIVVRPDAMRQGYGIKLLDELERTGVDLVGAMRANSFSSSGRALATAWLEKKVKKMAKGGSNYQNLVTANFEHMQMPPEEWKALPIIGFTKQANQKGKDVMLPMYDFTVISGYKEAPTLYPSADGNVCCELCTHPIARVFWIYNPKHRVTLRVGSECVKHFSEIGVSGEEWERKAKIDIALQLDQQLIELRKKIKDKFSSPKIEYGYRGKSTTTHFNNLALDWYLDSNESDAAFVQKLKANLMKADIDFSVFKHPKTGLFYPSWRQIFEMLQPLSYSQSLDYQLRTSKNEAEAIKNAQKELLSWYTKNGESQAKKAENIAKLFTAYTQ